ncbi:hypothetical protein FSP39_023935 [Pinctada imbricata]|uniref:Cirhin n=1 Tax=Pinctada imbricata TaxID=66713 RepID=A0AA88XK27_PINIB|nr:hypothetical protein FSP39_023935 [Pinctada imbricata]
MGEFRVHHVRFFNYQPKTINCIHYGKEANKIAIARSDASIEIWSVKNNWYQESVIPGGEERSVEAVCWQEGRLFSAGLDGDVEEYDLQKLQSKTSASSNAGPLWCVASDSAGKYLAAGAEDGCVVLFDTDYNSLQYYKSFDRQEGRILSLAWNSTDDIIVTGGTDNIRLWSVNSGHALQRLTLGRTDKNKETIVWCVAFAKDMTIVSGDSRGKTIFWNGRQGTQIKSIQSHKADVLCLTVDETEETVFSSGVDPVVAQFDYIPAHKDSDMKIWVRSAVKSQHTHDVRGMTVVNGTLVSGGVDTNIILNNIETKKGARNWRKLNSIPHHKVVHVAKQRKLVLLQYSNYLELWKLGHTRASSDKNGEILPLESNPLKLLQLKTKDDEHIVCSGISSDGEWLCYADQFSLRLYKVTLNKDELLSDQISIKRVPFKLVIPPHRVEFSPDAEYLVSASNTSTIQVVSLQEDQPAVVHSFQAISGNPVHLMSVSTDKVLAVADVGHNITLYNLQEKKMICSLPKYSYVATAMIFGADPNNLVIAYADQKILEFSIPDEEYTEWCKTNCNKFPSKWLKRYNKISHISMSPAHPDKILLGDDQTICVLNKSEPFPSFDADIYNRTKWAGDGKANQNAFHICSKYKYMLHMELLEDDWLVIVEQTPIALSETLPMTLAQKKFGT